MKANYEGMLRNHSTFLYIVLIAPPLSAAFPPHTLFGPRLKLFI